jgi:hypothetical protein
MMVQGLMQVVLLASITAETVVFGSGGGLLGGGLLLSPGGGLPVPGSVGSESEPPPQAVTKIAESSLQTLQNND